MKKFKKLALPYGLWLLVLVGIPLVLMVVMSFLDMERLEFENATFSVSHFKDVFNSSYLKAFGLSMKYAAIATIGCILLGYPIAYIVARSKMKNKFLFLVLFILPMWTNLLLRIETINNLLKPEGFLKSVFGISLNLSGGEAAIILCMIVVYLPFMIFPIYTVLEKLDNSLLEAAQDLGANPAKAFVKVTLPLSLKGVMSGITMVFLPCAMGFTIPEIVSNGNIQLIGNIIESAFKGNAGIFNQGCLIALVIIVFVMGALFIIGKVDEEGETLL